MTSILPSSKASFPDLIQRHLRPSGFNRRDDAGDEPRGLFDIEPDSKDRDP
jgi:hypothetical protein